MAGLVLDYTHVGGVEVSIELGAYYGVQPINIVLGAA
jgi:hypothetical protein